MKSEEIFVIETASLPKKDTGRVSPDDENEARYGMVAQRVVWKRNGGDVDLVPKLNGVKDSSVSFWSDWH